jgi:hypothetical protein
MPQGIQAAANAGGPTSHTTNQTTNLAKLRTAFPADQIHALPRLCCKACNDSRTKVCDQHRKQKCRDCGNYITTAHVDLSYVGHAELTHRLLDADPLWDWEPLSLDQRGLPQFDENGGLWIRLTVCGHSRLGYGDSQGKKGPNAIKEAIGDALRNAAMRFGAALDLWAKSDLKAAQAEHPKSAEDDVPPRSPAADRPGVLGTSSESMSGGSELEALKAKVNRGWNNVLACEQNLAEARQKKLLDATVPVGEEQVRVEDLLSRRIGQLKADQSVTGAGEAA